jgi:isocitrate/isopropylmalate dehydrogenase
VPEADLAARQRKDRPLRLRIRANGRKKVTCFTKDNIMKMTDGLFHKVFDEIGAEYPEIEKEHWIVDIGAAKLADTPEAFDVIVMPNLYGDILSDVAAQIAGSVGLAGSANIGDTAPCSRPFTARRRGAPDRIWRIPRACCWAAC